MRSIGLLIFDLDGTLVNTLDDIAASVNHSLLQLGRGPIPADLVRQYVGDGIEMLMTRALGGHTVRIADAVDAYKVHHREHLTDRSSLYPSVRETLEHFRELPMAVISNKAAEFAGPLLDRLGISGYFGRVIGADAGLPMKPEPDALLKIMDEFGVRQDRTVIVGDGTADMLAGKAAGVITCGVTYGFRSAKELRELCPDYLIDEFAGLAGIFSR